MFSNEPILEVVAPMPEAQLIETFVMNQIHVQTVQASKAQRVVTAANGRPVVDFGARRMHGIDAALKAARAFWIGGVASTSNVLAGKLYGVPVAGTMAHSYIQAHENERAAFRAFAKVFPETVLLVDTYDTLAGVQKVIDLAKDLGEDFKVKAVRLDSGDLLDLSREARRLLDEAGLGNVEIFASGGLNEDVITTLLSSNAPIDGFGVGTSMGVSSDAPDLDIAYKLSEYAGKGRLKLSTGKPILPGRKQVFRIEKDGQDVRDVIACADEDPVGRPLLVPMMRNGKRLPEGTVDLTTARQYAQEQIARLPERVRAITPADPPYLVDVSQKLSDLQQRIIKDLTDLRERLRLTQQEYNMAEISDSLKSGDALLIVDVQKDFCPGGALPVEGGDKIVPVINHWIAAARSQGRACLRYPRLASYGASQFQRRRWTLATSLYPRQRWRQIPPGSRTSWLDHHRDKRRPI